MGRRLPPLNALRALEAAGRHVSFTRAASELHVTPGAISRQIKLLEDYLGLQLFDRSNGGLALTEKSRDYVSSLTDVFGRIDMATQRLLDSQRDKQLHLACSMTFTLRWLVPRLPAYHARYPKRDLRLTTTIPTGTLSASDVDVAIRLDTGAVSSGVSIWLMDNELIPVCSPRLLENGPPLKTPADLARHTLLHSMLRPGHWPDWLSAARASGVDPESGIRFSSSSLAYQAAVEGLGLAIGQIPLVLDDLLAGRLVAPFPIVYVDRDSVHLVYEDEKPSPKVAEFHGWITEEAAAHNKTIAEHTTDFVRVRKGG